MVSMKQLRGCLQIVKEIFTTQTVPLFDGLHLGGTQKLDIYTLFKTKKHSFWHEKNDPFLDEVISKQYQYSIDINYFSSGASARSPIIILSQKGCSIIFKVLVINCSLS
jgi:hypothetical protein